MSKKRKQRNTKAGRKHLKNRTSPWQFEGNPPAHLGTRLRLRVLEAAADKEPQLVE